jgi:hypothetical protein
MRRLLALSVILNLILSVALVTVERHRLAQALHKALSGLVPASSARLEAIPPHIEIAIDPTADLHPISPYIYGVAKRDPGYVAGLGAALNRWGGNPSSRYNWVIGHAWNAGDDWEFHNLNYGVTAGSEADRFAAGNRSKGMASLITIPALGWVARSDRNSDQSTRVPADGGPASGPLGQIAGYDPTRNRQRTSVPSLASKPGPFVLDPDPDSSPIYQDEWVHHLVAKFGSAAQGGVRFYAIDNEPMLWSSTHRDVHPARVSYAELLQTFLTYAGAVKAVDPGAEVLGPESCCWYDYWYSELDRGSDNFATHADRKAHQDVPLIPWFLRSVKQHDFESGIRTLDVLSVHFYPQAGGVHGDRSDPKIDALRLRSTRALWDPTYVDESWIAQPVRLFPWLREVVASNYPGTRIGLTEYNFGGGDSISAGLAEAEVLGILGREDVYLASYWTAPKPGSPTWFAFRLYRNYDGLGASFGTTSIRARSSVPGAVSAYASREPGWIDVILVSKQLSSSQPVTMNVANAQLGSAAQRYQYSGQEVSQIVHLPDLHLSSGKFTIELPAASMTLIRIPVK